MEIGIEFGNYKITEHIGRGGMADVWSARDLRLSRTVAIKTIARYVAADLDPVARFESEARTIAALEHPHILPIYEFGDFQGQLYIVMRYVSGGSLEDLLDGGALPIDEVLRLARPIAQALDYAHQNKVIHLDLKPSNILLDSMRSPYLADFGLATVLGPEGRAANPGSGTLLYMAPEQLTAADLDLRADVYAFSILIHHMLTGQLPFEAPMPLAIKQLQSNAEMPDLTRFLPNLPPKVTEVLRHGTAMEPRKRAGSIMTVFEAVEAALTGIRVTAAMKKLAADKPPELRTTRINQPPRKPGEMTTDFDVDMLATQGLAGVGDLDEVANTRQLDTGAITIGESRPVAPPPSAPEDDVRTINVADTSPVPELHPDAVIEAPPDLPPGVDPAARMESMLIYTQARRSWAGGQGKFLIGFTPFMLMNDFYTRAEELKLELDEQGTQMFLRGALEYDYQTAYWWDKLTDDSRRWVVLHTLRSQNVPAQLRALERLAALPDADPPQIPKAVGALIQNEVNPEVRRQAIRTLERRSAFKVERASSPILQAFENPESTVGDCWNAVVFAPEIDTLLGAAALDSRDPITAETAARAVGRVRSAAAVHRITQQSGQAARNALALIRDEAPMLPPEVPQRARISAWLANTWRRITSNPSAALTRFVAAALGGWVGMAVYIALVTPSLPFLDPDRIGLILSVGLIFGVFFGLQIVIASEFPGRLRGFWHAWARGVLSFGLGLVTALFGWAAFTWLYLHYDAEDNIITVALGTAIALAIPVIVRLPIVIRIVLLLIGLYVPIAYAWFNQTLEAPPILYLGFGQESADAVPIFLITVGIISTGAYLPDLIKSVRKAVRRIR